MFYRDPRSRDSKGSESWTVKIIILPLCDFDSSSIHWVRLTDWVLHLHATAPTLIIAGNVRHKILDASAEENLAPGYKLAGLVDRFKEARGLSPDLSYALVSEGNAGITSDDVLASLLP